MTQPIKPNPTPAPLNRPYLFSILALMLLLPLATICADFFSHTYADLWSLIGKWFVFWAVGVRLFAAGLRQTTKPEFTAEVIFHIEDKKSYAIVRELGFANLSFGTIAIISLFDLHWRIAAASAGGLYLGIAGLYHLVRKPSDPNELIALISDLYAFVVLALFVAHRFI
jgi:hypothetical protein